MSVFVLVLIVCPPTHRHTPTRKQTNKQTNKQEVTSVTNVIKIDSIDSLERDPVVADPKLVVFLGQHRRKKTDGSNQCHVIKKPKPASFIIIIIRAPFLLRATAGCNPGTIFA